MSLTGLAFTAVFLVALIVALARYPIIGLFAYITEFYVHPPSRWWGQFLPDLRWSMLAASVTLVALAIHARREVDREPWYRTVPAKLMFAFVGWFWLQTLWALDPTLNVAAAEMLTKYILVFYLVYRLIDTPAKMTAFLLLHVAGCLYLGVLAHGAQVVGRLDGVGGPGIDDSNTLGMHLGTGVIVAAILTLHLRGWRKWLCIVSIAFACNAIVLTASRGAFVALLVAGVALYYFRPPSYKKAFYAYAILGVLLFGYVASSSFWQRMDTVTAAAEGNEQEMDTSEQSRIAMIKAQLAMAPHCLLGCGHRGSEILSPRYLPQRYMSYQGGRSSHNVLMTLLVEQGIPGVVIFLVSIVWVTRTLKRLRTEGLLHSANADSTLRMVHAAAIGGALTVVLIAGMFADFSKCEVQIWMAALLASLVQMRTVRATERQPASEELVGLAQQAQFHISTERLR